jgi:chondroitin sulfate N-acetylgalactosaminyltransferase 1/2
MKILIDKQLSIENEADVYSYSAFTLDKLYPAELGIYKRNIIKLTGAKKSNLHDVIHTALNDLDEKNITINDFLIGFYRVTPIHGYEYELYFKLSLKEKNTCCKVVRLKRPLQSLKITNIVDLTEQKKTINFILPLSYAKLDRFHFYLSLFHLVALNRQEKSHVTLTVVYSFFKQNNTEIESIIDEFKQKADFNQIKLVYHKEQSENTFSRAKLIEKGVNTCCSNSDPTESSLMFFSDVDIAYTQLFLDLCRHNTVKGKKVYFPILYSLYNPKLLKKNNSTTETEKQQQLLISKDTGFWRDTGFGMTCLYRSDFPGFDLMADKGNWGGEDLYLYRKFINQSHLEIVRSITPSLFHIYHPKECNLRDDNLNQYNDCVKTKIMNEASQKTLGLLYFNLNNSIIWNQNI